MVFCRIKTIFYVIFAFLLLCILGLGALLIVDRASTANLSQSVKVLNASPVFFVWKETAGETREYNEDGTEYIFPQVVEQGVVAMDIHPMEQPVPFRNDSSQEEGVSWHPYVDISGVFHLQLGFKETLFFWWDVFFNPDVLLENVNWPWSGDLYVERFGRTFFFANEQENLNAMVARRKNPDPCYLKEGNYPHAIMEASVSGADFFATDRGTGWQQELWLVMDFPLLQNHVLTMIAFLQKNDVDFQDFLESPQSQDALKKMETTLNTLTTSSQLGVLGLNLTELGERSVELRLLGAKPDIFDGKNQQLMPEYRKFLLQGVSLLYDLTTPSEVTDVQVHLPKAKKGRNGLWDILTYEEVNFDDTTQSPGREQ